MAFSQLRKLVFQNPSSGKVYHVIFKRNADGSVDFEGRLKGTNKVNSDPNFDDTTVTGVVLTSKVGDVFGTAVKTDSHLSQAALYDAASRVAAGAALSTLLV